MTDGLIPWLLDRRKQSALQSLFSNMSQEPNNQRIDPSVTASMAQQLQQQQQYKSALARMASIDPEKYGAAAIQASSPDADLDNRLKALQLENAKNGGISGDSVQAQVINSYIRMGIPAQQAMMMVMSPELVQRNTALSNFASQHGIMPNIPSSVPMPSASPVQSVPNQNVTELINQMQGFGGVQSAPVATSQNMPASPAQMQAAVQAMQQPTTTSDPMAAAPTQVQQESPAPVAAVAPASFTRQAWEATPDGQSAVQSAMNQPDPQKYYDELYKQAYDRNKDQFEQAGRVTDAQKQATGQDQFKTGLDEIQKLLDEGKENGWIASNDRNIAANAMSIMANASPTVAGFGVNPIHGLVGASGSRMATWQNKFDAARAHLVGAYKAASGTTGGQMNSEAELAQFLKGLPSPTNTYEANKGIVEQMRQMYTGNASKPSENANQSQSLETPHGAVTIRRVN